MVDWAAEDDVGAAVADVVDDELVVLDEVVVGLAVDVVVLPAVVGVELVLEEELAPAVVLVLDEAELAVVVAIVLVVSGTVDDEAATVVSVLGGTESVGSVTAADLGDSDWALAFDSLSASIPPRPEGRSPKRCPSTVAPTLALPPSPSPWAASPMATESAGPFPRAWIARGAPTASAVTVDNVRASRKRGRTGASRR